MITTLLVAALASSGPADATLTVEPGGMHARVVGTVLAASRGRLSLATPDGRAVMCSIEIGGSHARLGLPVSPLPARGDRVYVRGLRAWPWDNRRATLLDCSLLLIHHPR